MSIAHDPLGGRYLELRFDCGEAIDEGGGDFGACVGAIVEGVVLEAATLPALELRPAKRKRR